MQLQPTSLVKVLISLNSIAYVPCVSSVYHTTFCMPTARRDESYLDQVVQSYRTQNVFRMDGITLVVLDTDNSTLGWYTQLHRRKKALCDATDVDWAPSCQVRQQGLDVTAALTQCANLTSGWVVLTEDDCEACRGALDEVISTLGKLDMNTIAMAKFSKFVRATAFPVDVVPNYVKSVVDRLYTSPYDVTVMEQWAPGRRQYIHTRNLFHHVGYVSTEAKRNDEKYRAAFAQLRGDVCFEKL
jgi:hypothetical protein